MVKCFNCKGESAGKYGTEEFRRSFKRGLSRGYCGDCSVQAGRPF